MKLFFTIILAVCVKSLLAQIPSGMGSRNFDHLYAQIKAECGSEHDYKGVKLKKRKVKKDLWIVKIVNKVMTGGLTIQAADSVLKKRGVVHLGRKYRKGDYNAYHLTISGDYIHFEVISATSQDGIVTFIGATLRSTYEIHCSPNPLFTIPLVDIDPDFFWNKVRKLITCRYQVFNDLELGAADYMATKLRFLF